MDIEIRMLADGTIDDLISLQGLLAADRELQGATRLVQQPPGETDLGGGFDALSVALGSGGAGAALAGALTVWLQNRHSDLKIRLSRGNRCLDIEAKRVTDANALIRSFLESLDDA